MALMLLRAFGKRLREWELLHDRIDGISSLRAGFEAAGYQLKLQKRLGAPHQGRSGRAASRIRVAPSEQPFTIVHRCGVMWCITADMGEAIRGSHSETASPGKGRHPRIGDVSRRHLRRAGTDRRGKKSFRCVGRPGCRREVYRCPVPAFSSPAVKVALCRTRRRSAPCPASNREKV